MAEALGAWQAGDHGVALDLWAPLAQAGVARAQSNMGAAFLQGQGVERDPDKAVAWLRRAADQGDAGAQRNLALCHYEGWACRRTRPWRRPGESRATGRRRRPGHAVVDEARGRRLRPDYPARGDGPKAAAQGSIGRWPGWATSSTTPSASNDPAQAAQWWGRARRDHAEAQTMLGAAYRRQGCRARSGRSVALVARAREHGAGELAAGFLREALAFTKPSQRAEAERRAAPLEADR